MTQALPVCIDRAFENVILPLSLGHLSIFASPALKVYLVVVDLQEGPHFIYVDPACDFDCSLPRCMFFAVYALMSDEVYETEGLQHVIITGEGRSWGQSLRHYEKIQPLVRLFLGFHFELFQIHLVFFIATVCSSRTSPGHWHECMYNRKRMSTETVTSKGLPFTDHPVFICGARNDGHGLTLRFIISMLF